MSAEAVVQLNESVSPTVRRLVLRVLDPAFSFAAGQFVVLPVPPQIQAAAGAKPAKGYYSVASAPSRLPELELLVEHRPDGGWVSAWVSSRLPGERLAMDGPLGHFGPLPGPTSGRAFLCRRAGLAPLRSLLMAGLDLGVPQWLFLGAESESDWLLHRAWLELGGQRPDFHYHPVLGPPEALAAAAAAALPRSTQCYVAGFTAEVTPIHAALQAAGFDPGLVKVEKFG